MPKMKSRSSVKKRYKLTSTGKVKRDKAYGSHLLGHKSRKRKRDLRKATIVDNSQVRKIKHMLMY
ncbi:MAG: 50S ribosomal protein L35 [Chitinivibrionales bacterium]|nr:50S ribosomal protein L35 [Chitinivibrionales bacterium]